MEYSRKWEDINDDKYGGCARLKVHGGWLVAGWSNEGVSESICFVPDSGHDWILERIK